MSTLDTMIDALKPTGLYSLKNYTGVYKELQSYAAELDVLYEIYEELIREAFITTAEDYGITLYERLDGPERTSYTLDERREMLIAQYNITCNDNTLAGVLKYFNSIGLECEITEYPLLCDIYIKATGDYTDAQKAYFLAKAEAFLPCHFTFSIDFRSGATWNDYDARELTFNELDVRGYTWQYIESYEEV